MKLLQCKNELYNKLGSQFGYNYKDGKREVSSLKFLKILDNTDQLTKNTSVKLFEYFSDLVIIFVLLLLLHVCVINYDILFQLGITFLLLPQLGILLLPKLGIIFLLLCLILLTFLVLHAYNSLILFFSYLLKYSYSCFQN